MSDITTRAAADLGVAKRSSRYPLYVFWVMYAINFLNWMDRNVFVGAANIIGKELGFGLAEIGTLGTAFIIINTLDALPLGIWADRGKRKNIVAVSVAIWSLATAALAPQAPLEEAADAAHAIPKGIVAQFRSLLRIKSLVVLIILQIFAFFTLGVISFYPI